MDPGVHNLALLSHMLMPVQRKGKGLSLSVECLGELPVESSGEPRPDCVPSAWVYEIRREHGRDAGGKILHNRVCKKLPAGAMEAECLKSWSPKITQRMST